MIKKFRIFLWAVVALVMAYTLYAYFTVNNMGENGRLALTSGDTAEESAPAFTPVAGFAPTGDFTLTDHNGEVFTQDSAAWKKPYKLIYFGFAYCPMICPTELQKMTKAINALPAEQAAKIQPLFISIDPERDTPEDLKTYISSFHKDFIGLTGTPEQIKHMADMWKVYYRKVEDDSLNGYTMDHSSYIYLQNEEGQILGLFRMKDSAAEITKYLAKTVD